jgi:hypothetical protein
MRPLPDDARPASIAVVPHSKVIERRTMNGCSRTSGGVETRSQTRLKCDGRGAAVGWGSLGAFKQFWDALGCDAPLA